MSALPLGTGTGTGLFPTGFSSAFLAAALCGVFAAAGAGSPRSCTCGEIMANGATDRTTTPEAAASAMPVRRCRLRADGDAAVSSDPLVAGRVRERRRTGTSESPPDPTDPPEPPGPPVPSEGTPPSTVTGAKLK